MDIITLNLMTEYLYFP